MLDRSDDPLDASEAWLREIIERNADAMLVIDAEGVIRFANPAAGLMFGSSQAQMIGRQFGRPITGLSTTEIELPVPDGQIRTAEMRVVTTAWQGQTAFLATLRDITVRKQAADAVGFLAHASQSLAGTLDYSDTLEQVGRLAVAQLADWCVVDLLDGDWVHRTGVVRSQPARRSGIPRLASSWRLEPGGPRVLAQVVANGQPHLLNDLSEVQLIERLASPGRTQEVRELGCRSAMVLPLVARGRLIGAITYVSTSESRRFGAADLALAIDLAHCGALAIDNARLYEASQTAVRHRDQFLAMLAHELRNPLAAIFSAVALMRLSADDQHVLRRAEEVIERQGGHMARLLDELLDISRVTHGKIELRRTVLNLSDLVRQAVDACQTFTSARRHSVVIDLPIDPLWAEVDATRIDQVLTNLLNNAAKYTAPGGTIFVSASCDGHGLVVRVRDNGAGISPDDLPHIFDLFVQADRPLDRAEGGLGIGLTLVRHLVEMHGGSVAATSAGRNRGSEFVVRLPAACRPSSAGAAASPARPARSTGRRVVIVEDNADAREMLRMLLTVEGYQVDSAEDGPTGLALIQSLQPDVAMVDIGLPQMDGYEIARRLQAEAPTRPKLLLALTGYGQPRDRQRALEAGFDEHLIKPVDIDRLLQLVAAGAV